MQQRSVREDGSRDVTCSFGGDKTYKTLEVDGCAWLRVVL